MTKIRMTLARCDQCGALSAAPDGRSYDVGEVVSRCALVYEKDDGQEVCMGTVFVLVYVKELGE